LIRRPVRCTLQLRPKSLLPTRFTPTLSEGWFSSPARPSAKFDRFPAARFEARLYLSRYASLPL
jgi:hypothetical protein